MNIQVITRSNNISYFRSLLLIPDFYFFKKTISEFGDEIYRKTGITADTALFLSTSSGFFSFRVSLLGFGFHISYQKY